MDDHRARPDDAAVAVMPIAAHPAVLILRRQPLWLPVLVALSAGLGLGVLLAPLAHSARSVSAAVPLRAPPSGLTHRLMLCNTPPDSQGEMLTARNKLQAVVDAAVLAHEATRVSVQMRDLDRERWFEIDGGQTYRPASLLKVPLLIAWLQRTQEDPQLLESGLVWHGPPAGGTRAEPATPLALELGKSYTVKQLLERVAIWSRNDATYLLSLHIDAARVDATCLALGLPALHPNAARAAEVANVHLTVGQMADFFRVLYDASWLDQAHSELALAMMSRAEFKDGLVAGLPPGTTVAHKHGVRKQLTSGQDPSDPDAWQELHDCGIVYAPGRPYLLCVMTKGDSLERQAMVVQRVSAAAWQVMTAR